MELLYAVLHYWILGFTWLINLEFSIRFSHSFYEKTIEGESFKSNNVLPVFFCLDLAGNF